MRKFAISDIHGCRNTFEALLDKIGLTTADELYLLGDYIDRGPDSKGVLDLILKLQQDGYPIQCLRGNHEEMLLDSRYDRRQLLNWMLYNGGEETVKSFGVSTWKGIPQPYLDFMEQLPYYLEVDKYILVHAGLNFDIPNPFEATYSMVWIRKWYKNMNRDWLGDRFIIHGHTPIAQKHIQAQFQKLNTLRVLDIDNGCVYPYKQLNHLCAFELTTQTLLFQKSVEDRYS